MSCQLLVASCQRDQQLEASPRFTGHADFLRRAQANLARADEALQRALALNPDLSMAHNLLAQIDDFFGTKFFHDLPPSFVSCTLPSSVPTHTSSGFFGDSLMP